ncbi:ABC transporter ATP-binding protein [Ferrovibrio sp.]|uniref:ABC transporter ATP-binding protein n=1 Tax=Ferrovibrio sp. TaxID=1917215 RepID=UPI003D27DB33
MSAVSLQNISYAYPGSGHGVKGVSLDLRPGELVAVIGPSGCGKSTLLKLIAGFIQPDAGAVLLQGQPADALLPQQRDIGIVFQAYALFPHMTALENVAYPLKLRGQAKPQRLSQAADMLGRVGLAAQAGQRPGQLSGGQQQRVALARALVFNPRALLLDEPLSALDASLRVGMRDEIRRLQREHSIATLHITHDQEEALSIADRVAVMRDGRLLQLGTPREIYERPVDAMVAGFVGQANLWPGRLTAPDRIDTAIGSLAIVPRPGFGTGQAAVAMLRPERVQLGAALDGRNEFHGEVVRDRYLGALRRFDLAVAGGLIAAETPSVAEGGEAASLRVHLPPDAIHLLPVDAAPAS